MSRALSFREAVLLVARREFIQRARDRSFFVSTAITIGIIVLVIVFPKALNFGADEYTVAFVGPDGPAIQAVAEDQAELSDLDLVPVDVADADQAEQMVLDGDLDAYLDADSVVVERELAPSLRAVLENAHSSVAGTRALTDVGLDPEQVASALDTAELETVTLDPAADERITRGTIAFIGALVLYGQLLGYGFWVALGVVEEKSSRVVEVLLSAIPARALLAGKVLGIGVLGLAQLFAIAAVSVAAAALVGSIAFEASMLQPITARPWLVRPRLHRLRLPVRSRGRAGVPSGGATERDHAVDDARDGVLLRQLLRLLQRQRNRTAGRLGDTAGQRAGHAHPDGAGRRRAVGHRARGRADARAHRRPDRRRRSGLRGCGAANGRESAPRRSVAVGPARPLLSCAGSSRLGTSRLGRRGWVVVATGIPAPPAADFVGRFTPTTPEPASPAAPPLRLHLRSDEAPH